MSFEAISRILRKWPKEEVPNEAFEDQPCERLRGALKSLQEDTSTVGSTDLAGLIRFVLRCECAQHDRTGNLTVPDSESWPTRKTWEEHGCAVGASKQKGFHRIEASEWSPPWLDTPECLSCLWPAPFRKVEEGKLIRKEKEVPCDPAVSEKFGFATHLSSAQRDIIRAVSLSRADSVNLVVLPTGSGKSLVGLSAALFGPAQGVSIIVVPTIALAYDQAFQAKKHCPNANIDAWRSELGEADKKAIKERIRTGRQSLLYASPESVTGTLSGSLTIAATTGLLRAFVVDEVHMISQWGNNFRPEFQSMAGQWRQLRRVCPEDRGFRTVLMTATLTDESFETIAAFYGPRDNIDVLASVHLRPEPSYYLRHCEGEGIREQRVMAALKHGPRPVILYATKRDSVDQWYTLLQQRGYQRVDRVHGGTSDADREQAIQRWRDNKVDIMVANSAFGLGMDKGDVRLVIHSCIPETVDRFYQEVGRGGRDGRATVSLLLFTDEDKKPARKISKPTVLKEETGLDRWTSIYHSQKSLWKDDIMYADLSALRPGLVWDSKTNMSWNLKTILLLERGGALRVISQSPPEIVQTNGETDGEFKLRSDEVMEKHWNACPVELIRPDTLEPEFWENVISGIRNETYEQARLNWSRTEQVLENKENLGVVLRELYRVKSAGIEVDPGQDGFPVFPPKELAYNVSNCLEQLFASRGTKLILVTYKQNASQSSILKVIERLVAQGTREVAIPTKLREEPTWMNGLIQLHRKAQPERYVSVRDLEDLDPLGSNGWPLPRVTLLDHSHVGKDFPKELLLVERPLHLILLPEGLRDPRNPGRMIGDVQPPEVMSISTLKNNLDA